MTASFVRDVVLSIVIICELIEFICCSHVILEPTVWTGPQMLPRAARQ